MYILNIASAMNEMTVKELKHLIFENYCRIDELDLLEKTVIVQ